MTQLERELRRFGDDAADVAYSAVMDNVEAMDASLLDVRGGAKKTTSVV